jgi:hypothetical protein
MALDRELSQVRDRVEDSAASVARPISRDHRGKVLTRPRMGFVYKSLDRMNNKKLQTIQDDSRRFFYVMQTNEKV